MPAPNSEAPLKEGVDYYMENGLFVLTAHYLEKRGYCCKNDCRHCPYGFEKCVEKDSRDEFNLTTADDA